MNLELDIKCAQTAKDVAFLYATGKIVFVADQEFDDAPNHEEKLLQEEKEQNAIRERNRIATDPAMLVARIEMLEKQVQEFMEMSALVAASGLVNADSVDQKDGKPNKQK